MNPARLGYLGIIAIWLLAAIASLHGCRGAALLGPPTLRMGRDECAECGMIISEDRFSSALLIERDGIREHILFDDIGCMLDYERSHADQAVKERFVHEHDTRAWRTASGSAFVCSDSITTPMGSGLAAFADTAAAEDRAKLTRGRMLSLEQLAEFRVQWRQKRYGQ